MLISGCAMRITWQYSGALAVGGTKAAVMIESSKPVRLSNWWQVVTGLAVEGVGFQSRNWTEPPPCARRVPAKIRKPTRDRIRCPPVGSFYNENAQGVSNPHSRRAEHSNHFSGSRTARVERRSHTWSVPRRAGTCVGGNGTAGHQDVGAEALWPDARCDHQQVPSHARAASGFRVRRPSAAFAHFHRRCRARTGWL